MIRLQSSVIVLGPRDLKDFEIRQEQGNGSEGGRTPIRGEKTTFVQPSLTYQTVIRTKPSALGSHSDGFPRNSDLPESPADADAEHLTPTNLTGDQNGHLSMGFHSSPENASTAIPPTPPTKDNLQYLSFDDSLTHIIRNDTPHPSSPFIPEDNSTPAIPLMPGTPGVRPKILPRSPLFRFQNISSSLGYRPESPITFPPGQYLVSEQDTTGYIQRTPRRPNRTFRHQTNSFSFDDSVRASAAYEQDRISSTSTTNSTPRPTEQVSLKEELRGSSLASERDPSADFSLSTGIAEEYQDSKESEPIIRHILPLPQLRLPPPFSTVPRSTSPAGTLPSLPDQNSRNLLSNLARDTSISPPNQEHINPPSTVSHAGIELAGQVALSSTSSSCPSPINILHSAARVITSFRAHSPSNRLDSPLASPSPSPTLRQNQGGRSSGKSNTQLPSEGYMVYNDQLSPVTQPQTPDHLPESRHRSRFHPSYTAPVTRARSRFHPINTGDGSGYDVASPQIYRGGASPSRRREARRPRSPVGLLDEGFRGLYGGIENGDEEQNWVEGVRFSNAEVRLWGLSDARGDGRSLRETPEREIWRIGRN